MSTRARPDLSWILNKLLAESAHGRHAVLAAADGLPIVASQDVDRALADSVAALASGLLSLSRSGARFVSGNVSPWQLTMSTYADGYLFIMAAAEGTFLVTSAGPDVDISAFSHAMRTTIDRLGHEMGVAPRLPTADSA
ncbi:roadblock/LC7 domain-containing protein [Streptomyces griseoviridis]|uniref:roadblock/LC7 domain-containing protein n=1 Tax=Streptomyces griseoviridis TaxID=45398 RepID=UPI00344B0AB2